MLSAWRTFKSGAKIRKSFRVPKLLGKKMIFFCVFTDYAIILLFNLLLHKTKKMQKKEVKCLHICAKSCTFARKIENILIWKI